MRRIAWPKHGYTAESQDPAMRAMREANYEIALIASEEPQAYRFARTAGIPVRVGFQNGWQKPLKSWWVRRQCTRALYRSAVLPNFPKHEVQVQFLLGEGLHGEGVPTHDLRRLRPLILESDGPREKRTLLQLTKKWLAPDRSAGEVASWLKKLGVSPSWRIVAAEEERRLVEPIARQAALKVEYFQSVPAWKEAVACARVLVTPDTGAAHLAGMIGTPVVDIFEARQFERYARRWAPWATPTRLLTFPHAIGKKHFGEIMRGCVAELHAQAEASG